jgi:hypothetical protein
MTEAAALPSATEAASWVGAELRDLEGAGIGEVHSLFVDRPSGDPAWLIARVGRRRAARLVALPLRDCAGAAFGVWVAQEGERIAEAPVVDPTRPLRREHELTICAHFGIGEKVGRGFLVASRESGEVSAVPGGIS